MSNPSEAARFKAEGNALFQKNQFGAAYVLYTQAIKHDSQNAILYCNRAACSLGLSRYLDAYTDATQATKIDSTYAKAWARLAAASAGLGKSEETINHWKRALAVLPVENLSPAQQKQKEQYESELKTAIARKGTTNTSAGSRVQIRNISEADKPWFRASTLLQTFGPLLTWNSSVWIIVGACESWVTGLDYMKQLQPMPTPAGMGYFGRLDAITNFSNAVVADTRAFIIEEQGFFERYNKQMMFELTKIKPWTEGGSRHVMEEAPKRLAREGWDDVRPALSLTVRGWIMRAFIQDNLTPNGTVAALDFYTSALEVLQWGNTFWKDIPYEQKGSVFKDTFIRGVKVLRLDTFVKAYTQNPGPSSKYSLNEILAGAQDLMEEIAPFVDTPPNDFMMFGFHLSFVRYPMAKAYSYRGFFHQHTARNIRNSKGAAADIVEHFRAAAKAYTQAADFYPQDDEAHVSCLHFALDALLEAGSPAGEVVELMNRIHDAIPVMKRIWEFSADAVGGRDAWLESDMALRDALLAKLQDGRVAAGDTVTRDDI